MTIEAIAIGIYTLVVIFSAWMTSQVVREEGKKNRKESQEIKTRLTQVRKDLNNIEHLTKRKR